ncbi:MAG: hypothetical protein ACRDRA_13340 [Pseudonocardiaceae bacterium]
MVNTGTVDRDGAVLLLEVILFDLPRLPGANCIGRHELYDELPGRPSPDEQRSAEPARRGPRARNRCRADLRK